VRRPSLNKASIRSGVPQKPVVSSHVKHHRRREVVAKYHIPERPFLQPVRRTVHSKHHNQQKGSLSNNIPERQERPLVKQSPRYRSFLDNSCPQIHAKPIRLPTAMHHCVFRGGCARHHLRECLFSTAQTILYT